MLSSSWATRLRGLLLSLLCCQSFVALAAAPQPPAPPPPPPPRPAEILSAEITNSGNAIAWIAASDEASRLSIKYKDILGGLHQAWLENGEIKYRRQQYDSKDGFKWKPTVTLPGNLKNIVFSRRLDGSLDIAGIGGDDALHILTGFTFDERYQSPQWQNWTKAIEPNGSQKPWAKLKVSIEGNTLKYTVTSLDGSVSKSLKSGTALTNNGNSFGWGQDKQVGIQNADGRWEYFWLDNRGSPSHMFQKPDNRSEWHAEDMGGYLNNLTVSRRTDGWLEISGLGSDRALYTRTQAPNVGWGPWRQAIPPNAGGSAWEKVTVTSDGPDLKYEVTSFDGNTKKSFVGSGELANNGFSVNWRTPVSILNADGRYEEFWLAGGTPVHKWQTHANIWQSAYASEAWHDGFLNNLTLVRRADGLLEVSGLGGNRALWTRTQTRNVGWAGWVQAIAPLPDYVRGSNSQWATIRATVGKSSADDISHINYTLVSDNGKCTAAYSPGSPGAKVDVKCN